MNPTSKLSSVSIQNWRMGMHWLKQWRHKIVVIALAGMTIPLSADQFEQITTGSIVNDGGMSLGAAWGDLDGDNDLDLFVANTTGQTNFFYLNEGDGTFTRQFSSSLVNTDNNADGVVMVDFNNDGHKDVFVANYQRKSLYYKNLGSGEFELQTDDPTMNNIAQSFSAAAADYNNDGLLDLAVVNEGGRQFLYPNTGDGHFVAILDNVVTTNGPIRGVSWVDYDNDRDMDLFFAGNGTRNLLFKNNGDGTFTKVTQGNLVTTSNRAYGSSWGDYDNDGDLDLLLGRYQQAQALYRNDGGTNFTLMSSNIISTTVANGQDCNWVDYDNDGFLDAYIVCQDQPNLLFLNNRNGNFTRITNSAIVTNVATTTVASWADYDQDGFLDVFLSNYNNQNNALYRNVGNSNNWFAIKLIGTASNRDAVGARIKLTAFLGTNLVTQIREITGGGGYQGQDTMVAHFGLANSTNINVLQVLWPSGHIQEFQGLPSNHYLELSESTDGGLPFTFAPYTAIFTNSLSVFLVRGLEMNAVHYTLDGSDPTSASPVISSFITVTNTITLKAQSFSNGLPVSAITTNSYGRFYAFADGVPNTWREQYFGPGYETDSRVPANADPDGDGFTNLQEYVGGTNPVDADSVPILAQIRAVPVVSWNSMTNKTYLVFRRDSLQSTNWVQVGDFITATGTNSMIVDLEAGPVSFYRIELAP